MIGALLALQIFAADPQIVVATRHLPPFSIKNDDGTWTGISIELWDDVARDAKIDYRIEDAGSVAAMLDGLGTKYGAAVGAITLTAEREELYDFTHPFYSTGLGIATRPQRSGWLGVTERLFSGDVLRVLFVVTALLFLFGLVIWLIERKKNPHFGGPAREGIGSGVWWSAVTMTTVGYGDKVPVTFAGRLVSLVWMYAAVVMVSLFTAVVTSTLTVSQLESRVRGPEDLPKLAAGAVASTTSEAYMRRESIAFRAFDSVEDGMDAVASGTIDAFVFDAPVLRHLAHVKYDSVTVLPRTFERQDYAIALPAGSPLREEINRSIARRIRETWYQDMLIRYLGPDS